METPKKTPRGKVIATIAVPTPKPRSGLAVAARARGARPFRNRRRERVLAGWDD